MKKKFFAVILCAILLVGCKKALTVSEKMSAADFGGYLSKVKDTNPVYEISIIDKKLDLAEIGNAMKEYPDIKINLLLNGCSSLTEIEGYSFNECENLVGIQLPSSVTAIGMAAFGSCKSLKNIDIPKNVNSIGKYAFSECQDLESIVIPDNVTVIDEQAFSSCLSLKNVTFPKNLISIEDSAFTYCNKITTLNIPAKVNHIVEGAFRECSSLTNIVVDANNTVYDSRNNCNAIIETKTNSLIVGSNQTIIPENVVRIGDFAFNNNWELKKVVIPKSVQTMGEGAFANCGFITELTISEGVNFIGDHSFYGCGSLTTIQIPSTVTHIGYCAFAGCSGLTTLVCKAPTPPEMKLKLQYIVPDAPFEDCSQLKSIVVPVGSVEAYKSADGWKDYAEIIIGE